LQQRIRLIIEFGGEQRPNKAMRQARWGNSVGIALF